MACDTPHNHRCSKCNHVWHHDPASIPRAAVEQAHACPECGRQEYMVDLTGAVPQFCSNGARCIKLDGSGDRIQPHALIPESPDDLEARMVISQVSRLAELLLGPQGIFVDPERFRRQ